MVRVDYDWSGGAVLGEESKAKLTILRQYFREYISIRCQHPRQSKFKLAIVEGFSGAGRYKDGTPGSPLIFVEELVNAARTLNLVRKANGFSELHIECLMICNDADSVAIQILRENLAPLLLEAEEIRDQLDLTVKYHDKKFEEICPYLITSLKHYGFENVLFILDQCGHSQVQVESIRDIIDAFKNIEMFYNFSIDSFLAFLDKRDAKKLAAQTAFLGPDFDIRRLSESTLTNQLWLGLAERLVFEVFHGCAPYVSPFSVHKNKGWSYWLLHFAQSPRAREVYNDILHANASLQAHFGRSGLKMLTYEKPEEGKLYLFDDVGRASALDQLTDDIPRLVSRYGDTIGVADFRRVIYGETPAHSDDIRAAIMRSPDLQVITPRGSRRRSASGIEPDDILQLRPQRSFHRLMRPRDEGN
ncbi:three-Cys-motif partner protein TcmP [Aestuariivirga sp.]|uniref:three-Cys-motif partner protein TcmP n=1 Tax=Aestuariivirga sp. TaxID=2650926 RepID=UPI0039E6A57D